jgi:O-antigen/teichoic acid export membrane protein
MKDFTHETKSMDLTSSKERKKRFLLGTASSYGTTIVFMLVGLISVPIGLHYFGPVRYGIWAVISSVIAYLSISNFGIPTAESTLIAKASEPYEQWAVLRRSLFLLLISSVVVLSVVLGIAHLYPGWVAVLGKVPANLQGEAAEAAIAIAILFLLNLPLTVFSSGFYGLQQVYWHQFYASLTIVARLVALILTVFLLKGNLVTLALFSGMTTLFVGIVCASHFLFTNSELRQKSPYRACGVVGQSPTFDKAINKNKEFSTTSIFTTCIRFFTIGLAAMVVWNTDNLVISHFIGPKSVTPYAITFALFTMGFTAFTAVNGALWPMYGHLAGRNHWEWIQQTYNHAVHLFPILGGLVWIGGIAFAREIINMWAGPEAYGGLLVVFALGGYGYTLSLVNTHATVLNALNLIKNTVVFAWLEAAFNLGISLALVSVLGIGGVALGTFLGALMAPFWILPLLIRHKTAGKVKTDIKPIMSHAIGAMFPCLALVLLTYLYAPVTWIQVIINIFIIMIYLALSWRIMSIDTRNLLKSTLTELYVHLKIKTLGVKNIK